MPAPTPEEAELDRLFTLAAGHVVREVAPAAFLDWIADAGPTIAPSVVAGANLPAAERGGFFRAFGRALYDALPQPAHGYRSRPMPRPGRNEACPCGSGRKYKHCCLALDDRRPPFDMFNLLRYVLDALPATRFAELPGSVADPLAVWDAARQWHEGGEARRATQLLEPWFAAEHRLDERLEPLFDLLMDLHLDAGRTRRRERLLENVLARGDRGLRAAALQRRATMLADRGEVAQAWTAFREAQREDPENPSLAHLELVLLAGRGEYDRVAERARFWLARFERRRDPRLADLAGFLREAVADPRTAFVRMGRRANPECGQLAGLFAAAPAPAAHYVLSPTDDGSAGPLEASKDLLRAEARWRKAFPQLKPTLTQTQHGERAAWDCAPEWLALLERQPLLWQSFEVIDDLAMALDALTLIGTDALLESVLERARALLHANLEANDAKGLRFEWGWLENRPALRPIAHLAFYLRERREWARFIALAEWLVALNPGDNHGLREPLSQALLETGEPGRAIALLEAYSDDAMAGVVMNRILALWRAGRRAEALDALHAARPLHAEVVKMLLADQPKRPRPDPRGIARGGKEEAWLYRDACLALWSRDGALEWLGRAWRAIRKGKFDDLTARSLRGPPSGDDRA